MNAHSRLVIEFNPIHFSYYVDNELKITINDKNLFYFEVTRKKILNDTPATTQATEPEKKHEKKIVIGFSRCDDGADHGAGGICGGYEC